jgi:hypothetical protein
MLKLASACSSSVKLGSLLTNELGREFVVGQISRKLREKATQLLRRMSTVPTDSDHIDEAFALENGWDTLNRLGIEYDEVEDFRWQMYRVLQQIGINTEKDTAGACLGSTYLY